MISRFLFVVLSSPLTRWEKFSKACEIPNPNHLLREREEREAICTLARNKYSFGFPAFYKNWYSIFLLKYCTWIHFSIILRFCIYQDSATTETLVPVPNRITKTRSRETWKEPFIILTLFSWASPNQIFPWARLVLVVKRPCIYSIPWRILLYPVKIDAPQNDFKWTLTVFFALVSLYQDFPS